MAQAHHTHHHHLAAEAGLPRIGELRRLASEVRSFNGKLAVVITSVLGSMPFFWFANVLAMLSLPAVLTAVDVGLKLGVGLHGFFPGWLIDVSLIGLVAWVAQTYIQLVALPVLQVSNNAQGKQQEANTTVMLDSVAETQQHAETILDRLDVRTDGGLKDLADRLDSLAEVVAPKPRARAKKKAPAETRGRRKTTTNGS